MNEEMKQLHRSIMIILKNNLIDVEEIHEWLKFIRNDEFFKYLEVKK